MKIAEGPVVNLAAERERLRGLAAKSSDPEETHSGHLAESSRRALARWREGRIDSRWRAWRESRAQRENAVPKAGWTRRSNDPQTKRWSPRRDEDASPKNSSPQPRRTTRPR
jgi:hypothetical protein